MGITQRSGTSTTVDHENIFQATSTDTLPGLYREQKQIYKYHGMLLYIARKLVRFRVGVTFSRVLSMSTMKFIWSTPPDTCIICNRVHPPFIALSF